MPVAISAAAVIDTPAATLSERVLALDKDRHAYCETATTSVESLRNVKVNAYQLHPSTAPALYLVRGAFR